MYPNETAYFSGPEARICISLADYDRKHSKVSKTVKILSVSITELILQAKTGGKSNQEVLFFRNLSVTLHAFPPFKLISTRFLSLWLPHDVNSFYP